MNFVHFHAGQNKVELLPIKHLLLGLPHHSMTLTLPNFPNQCQILLTAVPKMRYHQMWEIAMNTDSMKLFFDAFIEVMDKFVVILVELW